VKHHKFLKHHKFHYVLLFLCLSANAEPWIDSSNLFLRENIQHLVDAGYITTPVTTFPLMWFDIAQALKKIPYSKLNQPEIDAYNYIQHELQLAKRNQTRIKATFATEDNRFTSFGDTFRAKNSFTIHKSFMSDSFALNLSPTYNVSPTKDDDQHLDGSYLAGFWGNWVISVGKQDRWWGPGWDSNLGLTNHAKPIPAVAISRKSATAMSIPFTEISIPWTVTSFMGVMDDNRVIKDTLLWGFRLNFIPIPNLEIGITRLAQWGGEGRPKDSSTFWNVFIGKDNCGAGGLECLADGSQEPGNQQAGYDFRYSFNLFDTSFGLYGQSIAEDGNDNSSFSFLTEVQSQIGMDMRINLFETSSTFFIEYADTYTDCVDEDTIEVGNCFYEHHIYQTGMRYKQRTLGNLYDNDASSLVFGLISNISSNTRMTLKLRMLKLNKDNSDKSSDSLIIGNPLTKFAENTSMLSTKVQHSYRNWRYTVGVDISQSTFTNEIADKKKANLFLSVEYNL
jgi:hypothetical protein